MPLPLNIQSHPAYWAKDQRLWRRSETPFPLLQHPLPACILQEQALYFTSKHSALAPQTPPGPGRLVRGHGQPWPQDTAPGHTATLIVQPVFGFKFPFLQNKWLPRDHGDLILMENFRQAWLKRADIPWCGTSRGEKCVHEGLDSVISWMRSLGLYAKFLLPLAFSKE